MGSRYLYDYRIMNFSQHQPYDPVTFFPQNVRVNLEEAVKVMDKIIIQVATWGCKML